MIPFLFAAVAAAASPQPAAAAASPLALTTTMLAETRVPAADGSVTMKLAAPNHVGPGDRVVVQLAYRNRGTAPNAGLVLANASDEPGLRWVARLCATLRERFPHVGQLVLREVAGGKRFGNVVVVASRQRLDDVSLRRTAAREGWPATDMRSSLWIRTWLPDAVTVPRRRPAG